MSDLAVEVDRVGKMYKLFHRPVDRLFDAFGLGGLPLPGRRGYRPFWALRDVSFGIARGERLGIVGRNGAGKSTLLKIIVGNIAPTEGSVTVQGRIQALLELGTGFHPDFTGRQNIRASLAYQGHSPAAIRARVQEIVDFAEIDDFIDEPIKTYSAGMVARLAFATATAVDPQVLVIDEVLGAGDAYFAGKCVERMQRLTRDSGATVLFVSHDLASVQRLCSRVIWLDHGHVVADASAGDVIKAYYLATLREEERRRRIESGQRMERLVESAGSGTGDGEDIDGRGDGTAQEKTQALAIPDRRGSAHAQFSRIVPVDAHGAERYVFQKHEPFGFQVEAQVASRIERCTFAVSIYGSDGTVVCQTVRAVHGPLEPRRCAWKMMFRRPNLRHGDYVCSFALYGDFDESAPVVSDAYAHWSRVFTVRIDEAYLGQMPLGVVELETDPGQEQPLEVSYQ